jgi:LysR family transcriptional regulator, carnitine catabolism transcriptional activator
LHGAFQMRHRRGYALARPVLESLDVVDSGLEVEQLATQAGLVAAGFGACLVPQCALPLFERDGILLQKVSTRDTARPIHLNRRKGITPTLAASAVLDSLRVHSQLA